MSAAGGANVGASGASKPSRRGLHRPELGAAGEDALKEPRELQRDSPSAISRSAAAGEKGAAEGASSQRCAAPAFRKLSLVWKPACWVVQG